MIGAIPIGIVGSGYVEELEKMRAYKKKTHQRFINSHAKKHKKLRNTKRVKAVQTIHHLREFLGDLSEIEIGIILSADMILEINTLLNRVQHRLLEQYANAQEVDHASFKTKFRALKTKLSQEIKEEVKVQKEKETKNEEMSNQSQQKKQGNENLHCLIDLPSTQWVESEVDLESGRMPATITTWGQIGNEYGQKERKKKQELASLSTRLAEELLWN
eukprot:g3744.t1